jgi:hypothetical protein
MRTHKKQPCASGLMNRPKGINLLVMYAFCVWGRRHHDCNRSIFMQSCLVVIICAKFVQCGGQANSHQGCRLGVGQSIRSRNKVLGKMARVTGLEPVTSGVTGRRSNQLSYTRLVRPAPYSEMLPCQTYVEGCCTFIRKSVCCVKLPADFSAEDSTWPRARPRRHRRRVVRQIPRNPRPCRSRQG